VTPLRYVLASGSPRRRDLIRQVGIPARICPAVGKETSSERDPRAYAADLARHKAQEIAQQEEKTPGDYCVIGADTIVVLDGAILGKPKDRADAKRMITALQGRSHEVITGVCLSYRRGGLSGQCAFSEVSSVRVVPMSEEEIDRYLATGEADDKAGAYGIQGAFGVYVAGIEGDYYNIVGLPISRLYQTMKEAGLLPELPG
jgi:septum formation protein